MAALKKRVDPDGVRNLIWRPQGNDAARNPDAARPPRARQAEELAQDARRGAAAAGGDQRHASARCSPPSRTLDRRRPRATALNELAGGQRDARRSSSASWPSAWDQLQAGRRPSRTPTPQADAQIEYDKLKAQIDATNLRAGDAGARRSTSTADAREASSRS